MVTRAQWGANEALRGGAPDYDSVVQKLIVHHTATPSNPSDPAAVMRSIYTHALDGGEYIDIQYNWLIDAQGRLYEGRWARDYPPGAPHTGELNNANVRGGHSLNHNSRTIGVSFIGTFTASSPTRRRDRDARGLPRVEVRAVGNRSARGAGRTRTAPARPRRSRTSAAIATRSRPNAPARRCTGRLPEIRQRVAARLRGGSFGYWIASADGRVVACGDLPDHGDTRRSRASPRRSSASPGIRRARATGCSAATAASSRSVPPGSSARPAASGSTRR